ncbi:MAG: hypothetical protein AAFX06_31425 [Planctomycetota bacterium]
MDGSVREQLGVGPGENCGTSASSGSLRDLLGLQWGRESRKGAEHGSDATALPASDSSQREH